MRNTIIPAAVTILVATFATAADEFNSWSDATGKFTVEANLAGIQEGKVVLIRRDGSEMSVPFEKLSRESLIFALKQAEFKRGADDAASKPDPEKKTSLSIDAQNLGKLIDAGEVAFGKKYGYQTVAVSGVIRTKPFDSGLGLQIEIKSGDKYYLSLMPDEELEKWKQLKVGDSVEAIGKMSLIELEFKLLYLDEAKLLKTSATLKPSPLTHLWTSPERDWELDAEFISATDEEVTLKKTDGNEIKVALAKLSPQDQVYIRRLPLAEQHKIVAKAVKQLGGSVEFDDGDRRNPINAIDFYSPTDDLGFLKEVKILPILTLSDNRFTDDCVEHINKLESLTHLMLARTQLSDKGLKKLRPDLGIYDLNLANTKVTDEGLRHLSQFKSLGMVGLTGTRITDDAMLTLSKFENLGFLYMERTQITSAGLTHLLACKNLTFINATGCKVDNAVVEKLRAKGVEVVTIAE